MPKENKFSGLSEPDKDRCTSSSEDNIVRFREATLKLDRIRNKDNDQDLVEKLIQLCIRFNKTGESISWDLDYADVMETLENVYNDVDADFMIMGIEEIAKQYGYLPEMDTEEVDVSEEMIWCTTESLPSLMVRIQTEYDSLIGRIKENLLNKIAGGMRAYEIERDNDRLKDILRGEIWRIEVPITIGSEESGYRWAIVISNEKHVEHGNAVNVVYLNGDAVKNRMCHMRISNSDLEDGTLIKNPCRVNVTDINTLDKKRFLERKGKLKEEYMERLMARIAFQIGYTDTVELDH